MDISGIPPSQPSSSQFNVTLSNHLQSMLDEYQKLMKKYQKDPSIKNTDKMIEFSYKLRSFLEDHKKELFAAEKAQGWPAYNKSENDGYEGIYNACMIGINAFLEPETRDDGSLYFVNEQITQLHWMLNNHPIKT